MHHIRTQGGILMQKCKCNHNIKSPYHSLVNMVKPTVRAEDPLATNYRAQCKICKQEVIFQANLKGEIQL